MPSYDRQRAHGILNRLLDLSPERRPQALDDACDGDEARRGAVVRLLRAAEARSDLLDGGSGWTESLWDGWAQETTERETPVVEGTRLGPYRILEEKARGGMAVVYRAERVDGEVTREVAVKILKLGLDTEEIVRRFEQERQILADLEHPNIARFYDAGRTEDGRPYVVMELVEGLPIDRYCDEHRLSVDERLELFCVVAGAVDSAHQSLVVHRDLKPSNILVNRAGEVKLLDFGIARLLDMEAGDGAGAPPTRTLVRMMTPEYASPEQVRGERVTTTSDVYQLGLLLYELLSGHRPYVASQVSPSALERAICEQMPTRPSSAVLRTGAGKGSGDRPGTASVSAGTEAGRFRYGDETVEGVCRARRTSAARLRRRLRGDLDNIVLKALRKEPTRRYQGADRLAQDIRRHLRGLPVAARADTLVYRGRKFLRRHVLGASATAAALVLAVGMTGYHTTHIQSERDRAEVERDRAQAEAARAEQMSQFLIGLFQGADPGETGGANLTARELLDRGVERVDLELAEQPETQADMLQALGHTYTELGLYDSAEGLLTRTLELRRRQLGPEHPKVAESMRDHGRLRYRQGEYEAAREQLEAAARIFEASVGEDAPALVAVLSRLGTVHWRLGDHEKSRTVLERALTIQSRISGPDSGPVAPILSSMAALVMEMGDLERAEGLLERVLAIYERELGVDHPKTTPALMNLATCRLHQGKLEGLETMYRRNLAVQQNAYGPDHVMVGLALGNLASYLTEAGRSGEAVDTLQRAIAVLHAAVGPDHLYVASSFANLGDAYLAGGLLHEARDAYQRSVEGRSRTGEALGFDPILLYALVGLGRTEAELGDRSAADESLRNALEVWGQAPDSRDPSLGPSLLHLGRWLAEQRRCTEAVPLLRRAAELPLTSRHLAIPPHAEIDRLLTTCGEAPPV